MDAAAAATPASELALLDELIPRVVYSASLHIKGKTKLGRRRWKQRDVVLEAHSRDAWGSNIGPTLRYGAPGAARFRGTIALEGCDVNFLGDHGDFELVGHYERRRELRCADAKARRALVDAIDAVLDEHHRILDTMSARQPPADRAPRSAPAPSPEVGVEEEKHSGDDEVEAALAARGTRSEDGEARTPPPRVHSAAPGPSAASRVRPIAFDPRPADVPDGAVFVKRRSKTRLLRLRRRWVPVSARLADDLLDEDGESRGPCLVLESPSSGDVVDVFPLERCCADLPALLDPPGRFSFHLLTPDAWEPREFYATTAALRDAWVRAINDAADEFEAHLATHGDDARGYAPIETPRSPVPH